MEKWKLLTLIIHGTGVPLYTKNNISYSVYPPIRVKFNARWIINGFITLPKCIYSCCLTVSNFALQNTRDNALTSLGFLFDKMANAMQLK